MLWTWIKDRASETSTWVGIAGLATVVFGPAVGVVVGKVGTVVVAVLAGGLVAHQSG